MPSPGRASAMVRITTAPVNTAPASARPCGPATAGFVRVPGSVAEPSHSRDLLLCAPASRRVCHFRSVYASSTNGRRISSPEGWHALPISGYTSAQRAAKPPGRVMNHVPLRTMCSAPSSESSSLGFSSTSTPSGRLACHACALRAYHLDLQFGDNPNTAGDQYQAVLVYTATTP